MAGPRTHWRVGDVLTVGEQVDAALARRLLAHGYAVELGSGRIENATVEPVENAAVRTRRPPGRPRKAKAQA